LFHCQEEERRRELEEEERLEREAAAKQAADAEHAERRKKELAQKRATLPEEPGADVDGHVKIAVQMPDGRIARRFYASDTVQSVYDFVDVQEKVRRGGNLPTLCFFSRAKPLFHALFFSLSCVGLGRL
jgi:uncharacterized protein YaiL (DUF2058 family)